MSLECVLVDADRRLGRERRDKLCEHFQPADQGCLPIHELLRRALRVVHEYCVFTAPLSRSTSGGVSGKPRCMDQQKPKTQIKMKDAKKCRAIYCVSCRTGCKSSEKIWSMKIVLQSHGETLRLRIKTLPVLLMNYHGVTSKSGTGFG